jgi:hypothetical protein
MNLSSVACLVEIALCNDRETPDADPDEHVDVSDRAAVDAGGAEVFLPVRDVLDQDWPGPRRGGAAAQPPVPEPAGVRHRPHLLGRLDGPKTARGAPRRCQRPGCPLARPLRHALDRCTGRALLSMDALSRAHPERAACGLGAAWLSGYGAWLDEQEEAAESLPEPPAGDGIESWCCGRPEQAHAAARRGWSMSTNDPEALRCFQFMNRVMRDQRVASQVAAARASDASVTHRPGTGGGHRAKGPQLQLVAAVPAGVHPHAARRADRSDTAAERRLQARVELLFFPTGGGKTEAYLGLAAYTFAIRRRQGVVETPDGPLDGRDGGDGADALHAAAAHLAAVPTGDHPDLRGRAGPPGGRGDVGNRAVPDRPVGRHRREPEALRGGRRATEQGQRVRGHRLTVLQIQHCPWCGTADHQPLGADRREGRRRVFVHCGDPLGRCPFASGGAVADGLPVLTVDEEIYRLTPAFVIATVDKFARLAREGEAAVLFGYVGRRCDRHGYVHPDYAHCARMAASTLPRRYAPATVHPVGRCAPRT